MAVHEENHPFEPDKEPSTGPVYSGDAGVAAPVDEELGNHVATGKNPEQKSFDN